MIFLTFAFCTLGSINFSSPNATLLFGMALVGIASLFVRFSKRAKVLRG